MIEDPQFRPIDRFDLLDLETVRLILRGGSVVDWYRLNFENRTDVDEFFLANEFRFDDPADRSRAQRIQADSVGYLRRNFRFPIPRPVENSSVEDLVLLASSRGHRQLCACTILKVMHIIHHLEGRELLFVLPLSDQELFHHVEEKVYRVVGGMLAKELPLVEFLGGRKNKDSLYTKLLSKRSSTAAQIYDKLRFRLVTPTRDDLMPVLRYLTRTLFPFNYCVPGESTNSLLPFRHYGESHAPLRALLPGLQMELDLEEQEGIGDNPFSARDFRVVHFVVDMPVRLPADVIAAAPPAAWNLGRVGFVQCEFQLVDRESEAANEAGESSHAAYKERQASAVVRRLTQGLRDGEPRRSRKLS